ncbi:MAG: cyclase family protein [Flavonifractor plautii]
MASSTSPASAIPFSTIEIASRKSACCIRLARKPGTSFLIIKKESYTMGKTVLVDLSHPFGRAIPVALQRRLPHRPCAAHAHALSSASDLQRLPHAQLHPRRLPSHVIPESPYTHELPLENYYGPAVCLDIPKKHWELITVEDIEKAADKVEGGIQEGDWVLICTGMNQRWGENDDYFMYSPACPSRAPLAGGPQGQGRGLRSAGAGPHPLYLRGPARPRPLRPPHRGRVQEGVWS